MNKTVIGQCIYCRKPSSIDDPLTNEHIFPFGIFGKEKLYKASCKKCRDITSNFEGKVQEDDMKFLRNTLNFPSRHKKRKQNQKLSIEIVTRSGAVKEIEVLPEDHPPVMVLPVFKPPAYISKNKYESGIEMVGYFMNPSNRLPEKIIEEHDVSEIAIYSLRWPEAWARMFAKIAYAVAVAKYGLDRLKLDEMYVVNAILGKANDIGRWVGNDGDGVFHGEDFKDQIAGLWLVEDEIHARIKLFSWLESIPEYPIVVGKLSE